MGKLDITIPPTIYKTLISVRIGDINYAGHLGHDRIITILHEARVRFLENFNMKELDVDGSILIIANLAIDYKKPAFYGYSLQIEIAVSNFENKGCDIYYCIINAKNHDVLATARTGVIFYNAEQQKVIDVPASFKELHLLQPGVSL